MTIGFTGTDTKKCTICKEWKPLCAFNKSCKGTDGFYHTCRACRSVQKKKERTKLGSREHIEVPATKKCSQCGIVKPSADFHRDRTRVHGIVPWCNGCVHSKNRAILRANPVLYKMKIMIGNARSRATRDGVPFNLTLDWLMDTFGKVTHCPALGIKIDWENHSGAPAANSPSLDKIDPPLGYVVGNVALISHKANAMKNDVSPKQLERFCSHHLAELSEQLGVNNLGTTPSQSFEYRRHIEEYFRSDECLNHSSGLQGPFVLSE